MTVLITLLLIPLACVYRILALLEYVFPYSRALLTDDEAEGMESKPLPEIPNLPLTTTTTTNNSNAAPNLTKLSTDARRHRAAVLRYLLAETALNLNEDERVDWAGALEEALDALGEAVGRGKWLAGVKRGRQRETSPRGTILQTDTASSQSSNAECATADTAEQKNATETTERDRLAALRLLAAQPTLPNPRPGPKHLLLCVAPLGSRLAAPLPKEDSGFALVPSRIGCVFTPGSFTLPEDDDAATSVLYGLAEWDATSPAPPEVRLVGGTFALVGATSTTQHAALRTALRVGVYVHLGLLLEQHFLADSGVRLTFPPPRPLLRSSHALTSPVRGQEGKAEPVSPTPQPDAGSNSKARGKTFLPGILSFFGKKHSNPSLFSHHRNSNSLSNNSFSSAASGASSSTAGSGSSSATVTERGGGSLDLTRVGSRLSADGSGRRFSFIGASPLSLTSAFSTQSSASSLGPDSKDTEDTFVALHARLVRTAPLLSASPNLRVGAPVLIGELAVRERGIAGLAPPPSLAEKDKEKEKEKARSGPGTGMVLRGDERVGLTSILGWDPHARDKGQTRGHAMGGAPGFVRMQGISVLVSRHIPLGDACTSASLGSASGRNSAASSVELERPGVEQQLQVGCGRPEWTTWRFYARNEAGAGADQTLGEAVQALAASAMEPCPRTGCTFTKGRHVQRIVHGAVRIAVSVEELAEPEDVDGEGEVTPGLREKVGSAAMQEEKEQRGGEGAEAEEKGTSGTNAKTKEASTSSTSTASTSTSAANEDDGTHIDMWLSCGVCGARAARRAMSEGTFLFSWAKFLELLVYSPAVAALAAPLCAHTDLSTSTFSSTSTDSSMTPTPSTARTSVSTASATSTPTRPQPPPPTSDKDKQVELPPARLNLVRHFAPKGKGYAVRIALSALDDVFELRVPRLQIVRRGGVPTGPLTGNASSAKGEVASAASARTSVASSVSTASSAGSQKTAGDNGSGKGREGDGDEKRTLRREIRAWWAGVADHMDAVETTLVGSTLVGFRKALPRLPTVDDAWDSADETSTDESTQTTPTRESAQTAPMTAPTRTKTPHWIAGLPPSAPTTPQIAKSAQEFFPAATPVLARALSDPSSSTSPESSDLTPTSSSVAALGSATAPTSTESLKLPTADDPPDSLALLSRMRETFQTTEQALYAQLLSTPVSALNDVRRAFLLAGRAAEKRLRAWQAKHLRGIGGRRRKGKAPPGLELHAPEPEWWGKGCHATPGGNVIIREDDWGSIIAFTMSTTDYYRELASMSLVRASPSTAPVLTPANITNPTSSFFSAPANYKLFTSSTQATPDPDKEDVVWYEHEAYSAVISRKEHPRDATSLLSLREVLRQKSPIDSIGGSVLSGGSSRFGSLGSAATKGSTGSGAPPSAWAKPDVQISRHAAGGEVAGTDSTESAGKILHEIESAGVREGETSRPGSAMSGSFLASAIFADMHIKRGKASSILSVESEVTVGGKDDDSAHTTSDAEADKADKAEADGTARHGKETTTITDSPTPTPSSFNTLTSGLSSAMRFMLNNGEIPRPSMFSKNHHGLLAPADASAIDERPHIKYDWTIGKRLKFSCTVYYAKQFDHLRKRCGIDDVFLKSLSRSANWAAEGGKSKSNFWKTADDRFIIKTLVNAWNVADLQVLIELAPSYFRYMDATASKATVLAKLIGFYTIEIRNLETGTVQSKADLLVMENLFYNQKIVKTFDLKGIQGRKVKSSASGSGAGTLFDGEWIEGQQRTLTLVRPHSKVVLREAIKSDAEFLAKSNIMDYSLLLGVDQEQKQIACGLVDTIGSYTFAKTLEYKAKQGLNSGKEVTVIPPAEYQERFVSALDGYFLACPDKWSRPMDDSKPVDDPGLLPSVL
ncbi:hypothetical protein B0H11DRAFT_2292992 [Mycena galericulata]|nr:hypothetical protein B0H11DRAFT_2292992 [Mycena galericulata]